MRKKAGNKGFTLIEMILVLAITILILTMVLITYNVVNNANATKCVKRLETVIRTARTQAMAKGTEAGRLTLTIEHGNLYAQIGDPLTAEKDLICNSGVTVKGLMCVAQADYIARNGNDFTTATVLFNTNGTVRVKGPAGQITTHNKFLINKGNRNYELMLYTETGAVRENMF